MNKWAIKFIEFYQKWFSPDHSIWAETLGNHHCRYHPTCSMYGKECFQKFSFFRASYLTTRRILRCHPWSKGGLDPVPDIEVKKGNKFESKKG